MKQTRSVLLVKRLFASAAALILLSGLFALSANAAVNTDGFAAEVVRLVNEERAEQGLPALNFGNKALNDAAMQRVKEFGANPSLGHTRPGNKHFSTVFEENGIFPNTGWTAGGENLAEGYNTPAEAVAGWMGSKGHKKNIMGGETDEGVPLNFNWIGVAVFENNGKLYWSQLFITSSTLADTGDNNPGGNEPGNNNNNDDSGNIFSDIWNWIMNIWNSITGFFSRIFGL